MPIKASEVSEAILFVESLEHLPALVISSNRSRPTSYAAMARVAAASAIEIGTDEGVHNLNDLQLHHDRRAASGASLKAIKLGGLTPRCSGSGGKLCASLESMKVNLACKTGESGVACAGALHAAAALPSLDWGFSLTSTELQQDILRSTIATNRGQANVPTGTGLGVEVDETALRRLQVPLPDGIIE